jgi:hypothetical protein
MAATCPFCNAPLTNLAPAALGARVVCPRCGEPMPEAVVAQVGAAPLKSRPAVPDNTVAAPASPGKSKTLFAILAVMVVMAVLGAVYVVQTQQYRRGNDFRTQKKNEPSLQSAPATEAPVLGLLPARCNLLADLHVTELLKQPATRRLFDADAAAGHTSPIPLLAGKLQQWTGLKPSDIEHIAMGSEISTKLPQLVILVQTRQPYLPGKVTAALAPATPIKHRQKLLVRFPIPPAGEGLLWCHSERILALVLCPVAAQLDDLDAIPPQPRPGVEGFAEPLRTALTERLPSSSVAWIAGNFEEPPPLGDLLKLAGVKNAGLDMLSQTKTLVVSVQPQSPLTVLGHFRGRTPDDAVKLQAFLAEHRWAEAQSWKVEARPPEAADPDSFWVTLQVRGDLAAWLAGAIRQP